MTLIRPLWLFLMANVAASGSAVLADSSPETLASAKHGTHIDSTSPTVIDGLYEVVAGENILYVDRTGRYLVVGSIYDLKTDTDLSAERRAEVRHAKANNPVVDEPSPSVAAALSSLMSAQEDLAIVTGSGETAVTLLTDPDCGYCRRMWSESLSSIEGVEVRHLLLSRSDKSKGIVCAEDPAHALHRAYEVSGTTAKTPIPSPSCKRAATSKLNRVLRFVQSAGLPSVTPILIREDGVVHVGYLRRSDLINWIGGQTDGD